MKALEEGRWTASGRGGAPRWTDQVCEQPQREARRGTSSRRQGATGTAEAARRDEEDEEVRAKDLRAAKGLMRAHRDALPWIGFADGAASASAPAAQEVDLGVSFMKPGSQGSRRRPEGGTSGGGRGGCGGAGRPYGRLRLQRRGQRLKSSFMQKDYDAWLTLKHPQSF